MNAFGLAFNICKRELQGPFFKNSMHFASLISNLILGGGGEDLEALVFRRSSVWGKIMDVLNIGSRP